MDSFFSCFSCGQKTSSVVAPQPIIITSNKIENLSQSNDKNNISLVHSIQDEKSKTATTITFRTTDTAASKFQDDQEYILNKIQQLKKKDLAEKKAIEQQFIRQNLSKSRTVYLVEKQWSEQYTKFLKDSSIKNIRPINNKNLIDSKGNLKDSIKQKQDYFIINERIWKFVQNLYGGGPSIPKDWFFPVYSLAIRKLEIQPCGIQNPMNLCFMNSVMQSLLSIQQFNQYFYRKQYIDSDNTGSNKKKVFHNALYKFIRPFVEDSTKKVQSSKQFAGMFESKLNPTEQHDAQEFFSLLTNYLQEQMKFQMNLPKSFKDSQSAYFNYMTVNRSIIDKIFAGQIISTVICNKCEQNSQTYLPFIDLCLQLTNELTLESCLKRFFQAEKLEDLYECEKCKKKSKAVKKFTLSKTPNYLMIVLKKFTPSGKKIEQRVKYSHDIDLKKFSTGHCGQTKFQLISVIVHKGSKSNKGHYYCYSKRSKKDWVYFNDESFKLLQPSECLGRDAYMLIYERIK